MKKKIIIFISIIIVVLLSLVFCYFKFIYKKDEPDVIKQLDEIDKFNYSLKSNASDIYKTEYENLKVILKNKEINYQEYAESISKLFIIDLYSMKNKLNKYDIDTSFIYPDAKDNFILNVQNTIYKYLEDNTDGERVQVLPYVTSVSVNNTKESTYKIEDIEYDSYEISLSWEYEKDLDYDKESIIKLIKKDDFLYIVEFN